MRKHHNSRTFYFVPLKVHRFFLKKTVLSVPSLSRVKFIPRLWVLSPFFCVLTCIRVILRLFSCYSVYFTGSHHQTQIRGGNGFPPNSLRPVSKTALEIIPLGKQTKAYSLHSGSGAPWPFQGTEIRTATIVFNLGNRNGQATNMGHR